ncbi:MAG: trypsin-like serine protease [Pseudomonadota bacterium]
MLRSFLISFLLFFAATSATAQSELISLEDRYATEGWEAVGRLDIGRYGSFCTATLIRDRLLLTAAHCVYDESGKLRPTSDFTFRAALRNGRAEATRGIVRIVPHPAYIDDGTETISQEMITNDIAVLELAQAIRLSSVQPFPISARPRRGDEVTIVSYGRDRSEAPSLQKSCSILGHRGGNLVMNCSIVKGSSGSPVFRVENGRTVIVSVVSATSGANSAISLGTSLQEPLQILLAEFAARGPARPGGTQRLMLSGERNDTGARFVKVGE